MIISFFVWIFHNNLKAKFSDQFILQSLKISNFHSGMKFNLYSHIDFTVFGTEMIFSLKY